MNHLCVFSYFIVSKYFSLLFIFSFFLSQATGNELKAPKAIILIYADDLGYGDVGFNGAEKIPTPHLDKLATQGCRFTNAYSTSATCTPSRYALMTGQYPWKNPKAHILPGDASMIIPASSEADNLASIMKKAGYRTGAVGKWHLGLGRGKIDWNKPIDFGLKDVGYDESFIIAATADRVPCVYIRDGKVENSDPGDLIEVNYRKNFPGQPTGKENPELLRWKFSHGHNCSIIDGISRIGYMKGGKSALWKDRDMADTITDEAIKFIQRHKEKPFFLYFGTNDIHVPRDPHQRFIGKSGCGIRGDVTVQLDYCVGRIVEALEKNGLSGETLIIFSSDNGPVLDDGYVDGAVRDLNGHKPAGDFSGGKYSLLEGGTRMPFFTYWPGRIKPGTSAALVSQMDIAPSLAALTGARIKPGSFPDAENMLAALLGKESKGRKELVIHGMGQNLALRQGKYKYYTPGSIQRTAMSGNQNTHVKVGPEGALYDLEKDPGEKENIISQHKDLATGMATRLAELRTQK